MAKKKKESFEKLLHETEELVESLESGELPLEEALKKYERGIANLRAGTELLERAEGKVKTLIEQSGGDLKLEDLDSEELDEEEDE